MATASMSTPGASTATPRDTRRRVTRFTTYALLVVLAVLFLIPVYMVLITSFKPAAQATLSTMWNFPAGLNTEGFNEAIGKLAPNFMNSIYLVVPATLISALAGSLNGYVLSKWRFRGSNLLFTLMLFGMFIPYQSILITLVRFLNSVGLFGSIWGLILVHVVYGLPITTLIFRNYYMEVPTELVEAGKIDGAGFWRVYRHIVFPISLPAFVVVIIWQFTQIWNEFLFGVTITTPGSQPITVALQNLAGSQIVQWNVQMAGALLTGLPPLLIYIFLGRYFIRGLLAGSVKG
ncbi:MAG TPA: carbohydrate ABC transporter permease [Aggregatilineales bacterium]|nr:carbohydrate ABC transporter permease [Aggregatilineales bacterium]